MKRCMGGGRRDGSRSSREIGGDRKGDAWGKKERKMMLFSMVGDGRLLYILLYYIP